MRVTPNRLGGAANRLGAIANRLGGVANWLGGVANWLGDAPKPRGVTPHSRLVTPISIKEPENRFKKLSLRNTATANHTPFFNRINKPLPLRRWLTT